MARALVAVVQAMAMVGEAVAEGDGTVLAALAHLSAGICADVTTYPLDGPLLRPDDGTVVRSAKGGFAVRVAAAPLPRPLMDALFSFVSAVDAARARQAQTAAMVARFTGRITRRDRLLRNLFDLSPIGVMLVDEHSGAILEANTAFLGFGRWPRQAVVGQTIYALLPPGDRSVLDQAVAHLADGNRFGPIEHSFQRPDGGTFPAVVRGVKIESGEDKPIVWVLVEDVSEAHARLAQVRAARDEAIRARAELDTAVQAMPHGFVLFDAQDRVVMVNDQMHAVYPELAPFFVPGQTYAAIMRAATAEGVFPEASGREEAFLAEIPGARHAPSVERLTELNGGRLMRVLDRATPDGGRVGLRIDVTNEHEIARRLGDVIAGSQAGTWEVNLATGENIVNDRWADMLDLRREDLGEITSEIWESLIHPDDRPQVLGSVARMIGGGQDHYIHTYRMRGGDGRWVWIHDRGRIIAWSADGTPARMAGVHFDISALKEAEERLEHIIEGAEAGTWQYQIKTGVNRINERWAEMLGYTRAELEPMTNAAWSSLVHQDDFDALMSNQEKRFSAGEWVFNYELRVRHKAGHWVWIQSRGQVTAWDSQGMPTTMSGVHLDISARKKLEVDLRTERDFLASLTDTSVSGIMAVDAEARILFLNREVLAIFEVPAETLIGLVCDPQALGITDHAGGSMKLADMPCRTAMAARQTVRDIRLRLAMPDGRTKVVSVNAAPLRDTSVAAQVVCTVTDITAAAEAEDRLRAAMDRAEAANRAKSQFLANMSHELRTPLNGVLGMAELLADSQAGDQGRAMVQTIRASGALLLSILNDTLDLAKIESGKLALADEVFSFADMARRIETMHGLVARTKGVGLGLHLGAGMGLPRLGDAQRLLQVMHNLVGNAVKFTETGRVDLALTADGDRVKLVVRDTGIGMTSEQIAIVFDEFTQADGSITRRFGGTGLGLTIVRRLVALMGGEIAMTSVPGQGTEVTLHLTLAVAGTAQATPPATPRPDFTGLRALVAEDNATNRVILRAMLSRLGIRVTMVGDGDEAVLACAAGQFDLLLLDISMPHKDGVTALAEIRAADPARAFPPAIAVTANAMTHLVTSYREAGFADVVAKPIQLDALAAAILKVCPAAALCGGRAMDAVTPGAGSRPCPTG